ncbi:sugar kinase [Levilactobacillus enshiensis]|uniref:sugar kinase n=1 Tax=Levilactobacillus enshiensis TaxID=2590213 RepID=UPI00117BAA96|nr:sugar kinase [Levilactobacillus enshiensis]
MAEFLTIGEPMAVFASTNVDQTLVDATDFSKFVAGAELNVAIGVSRLGHQSEYISAVGQDPFGKFIRKAMTASKVGNTYVSEDAEHWTGFYLKERVSHGDPKTFYFRKNSAAANFNAQTLDQIDFDDVKIAHLSGIFAALSDNDLTVLKLLSQRLRQHNKFITFDPNLRPALWDTQARMVTVTNDLAKNADLVMPGIHEGEILMGSTDPEKIADFYLNQSEITQTVIVKLGPKGAYIKQRNGQAQTIPGFHVQTVVDTVGAGDGFAVGLITGLLDGLSIAKAARRGCAIGALAVMSPGDNDGYPTPAELDTYLQSQQTTE